MVSGDTRKRKETEMLNEKLVEILEEAQIAYKRELRYFDEYANETDDEMKQIYWTRSQEFSSECEGLLTAYEIITGRAVLEHNIDWELRYRKSKTA